jgi:NADH-quinone oxidoreductase subunit A
LPRSRWRFPLFLVPGDIILSRTNPTNPASSNSVKDEPYESGIIPFGDAKRRIPIQFYVIAVLFVLFDVEVILMYPWAVAARQLGLFGLIEMAVFIVILLVGFIYAWKNGAFKWQ